MKFLKMVKDIKPRPQIGDWIEFEKHLLHTMPLGLGILCKSYFLFLKKISGGLFFDVLIVELF